MDAAGTVTRVRRYVSEANHRWAGFEHRDGDIVVSTRSKCGTTWVQMICALLVFGTPRLPAPLAEISPWLDWDVEPLDVVRARLDAQRHRRIIKTHTPLDGLPLDERVTYLVVGRHPLDVAVSLYHHTANLDRAVRHRLSGRPGPPPEPPPVMPLTAWTARWIDPADPPTHQLDTLPGLVHHVADAWDRQAGGNVVLLHYRALTDDLAGQMRALASRLAIDVAPGRWPELVEAASFAAMRADAERTAPDRLGVLIDRRAFFRSGRSGEGAAALTPEGLARYHRRMDELTDPPLRAWLDR